VLWTRAVNYSPLRECLWLHLRRLLYLERVDWMWAMSFCKLSQTTLFGLMRSTHLLTSIRLQ